MPSIDHCTNIRIGIVAYMIHDIWLLAYKSKMWKKYTVPFVLDFDSLSQWPFFLRYTIPSKCSQVAVFYQKMSLLRTTDTWGWEKLILFTNRLPYTAVCARLFPHTHHTHISKYTNICGALEVSYPSFLLLILALRAWPHYSARFDRSRVFFSFFSRWWIERRVAFGVCFVYEGSILPMLWGINNRSTQIIIE